MKALFIHPAGAAYGSGLSMLNLLRVRKFDAEVVCPGNGVVEEELRELDIKHYPLEFGKYSLLQNPLWHLNLYYRLRHILRSSNPDVAVINLDGNTPLITLAVVRAAIPLVRYSRFEFKPPRRWLDKWCWLQTSAVICPSNFVKQQFLDWVPAHFRSRVHRLYDPHIDVPVLPENTLQFRNEFGLGTSKTIIYVGRLHRQKKVETVIHAMCKIRVQFPDARLLIVGAHVESPGGVAYYNELRDLATSLGLHHNVLFLGYRNPHAVFVAISVADVCILPSESESFGMVLAEAWSLRVPTVASDVAGCREITLASDGGLLFSVGDHESLAEGVVNLLAEPMLARNHAMSGWRWVKQNCDPESYARHFHDLMQQVIQNGKS